MARKPIMPYPDLRLEVARVLRDRQEGREWRKHSGLDEKSSWKDTGESTP